MKNRTDTKLERIFRWIITIIAVVFWLVFGFVAWMALLARVGVIYCTALFVRIVDGRPTDDLAPQMDYALHFYVDGLLRYLEATRPEREPLAHSAPPIQKGRFKYEALYSLIFYGMWFAIFPLASPLLSQISDWIGGRVSLRILALTGVVATFVTMLWAFWIAIERFLKISDEEKGGPVFFIVRDVREEKNQDPSGAYPVYHEVGVTVSLGCRSKEPVCFDELQCVFYADTKAMSAASHILSNDGKITAHFWRGKGPVEPPSVTAERMWEFQHLTGKQFQLSSANSNFGLLARGTGRKIAVTLKRNGQTAYGPFTIQLPWEK